ncbi:uncharacterized protein LOC106867466 [Octopus bimaculoides]|uniref:Uncharacterized protein n=2 Tax=Octopus bimaculoides TaxID=37653 RepID=A0A0L8I1K9_OCTBM|nr:uncharacterized protein LOC106867466 [Octopus bimaculoides]|eukprot:XP_014767833.1 PREDICTED: uncharacterized protein LOC106867466 [Octopus bimaculoides]
MKLNLSNTYNVELLKSFKTQERFNVLRVSTLFSQAGLKIIVGGEDGIIRIYELSSVDNKPKIILETKSGPIQSMVVHDVTKFYDQDLIVADSLGMLTIFCNQQILSRQKLSNGAISHLQIRTDQTGDLAIVTSDEFGIVCASKVSEELWKINLNNKCTKELKGEIIVKSLLSVDFVDQHGHKSCYVLISDNMKQIFVLRDGSIVNLLTAPGVIVAMCKGSFVNSNILGYQAQPNGDIARDSDPPENTQVLLGTENGAIYFLHNFTISVDEYARVSQPILDLQPLHLPDCSSDLVLCSGYYNAITVFLEGRKICQYTTPDWVSTMDIADTDEDGTDEIILGCKDNTIQIIKLSIK